jgi:hypothetical protein
LSAARTTAVALLLAAGAPRSGLTQDSALTRTTTITYLTSTTAYVGAGRSEGLREGADLQVLRGGAPVAALRVAYLASHQASCDILTASVSLTVGDTVRFAGADARAPALAPDSGPAPRAGASRSRDWSHPRALRGRLGIRYLDVVPQDGVGSHLDQPSLDLRLDGAGLGGSPLGLSVDVRTRRASATRADGTSVVDGRTRVYQAAVILNAPGAPFRLSLGRQFSPAVSSLTMFDGGLAEFYQPRWSVGAFGGVEPDALDLGFSTDIQDYGAYFQLHSRPSTPTHWSVTVGGIGSYEAGSANREFAYLQAAVSTPRFSLFATQEMDYYRPWKRALGESAFSLTSTFANLRYEFVDGVSITGGVDNRRNVRLYRDAVSPETAFDDTYRRGVWGGLLLQPSRHSHLGGEVRSSTGGAAGTATAYSGYASLDGLTSRGISLRVRTTRYVNPTLSGWLHAVNVGFYPVSRLHLELNGGLRQEENPAADPPDLRVTWVGADLDLNIARAWYLLVSASRERGELNAFDQFYGSLTYRF